MNVQLMNEFRYMIYRIAPYILDLHYVVYHMLSNERFRAGEPQEQRRGIESKEKAHGNQVDSEDSAGTR